MITITSFTNNDKYVQIVYTWFDENGEEMESLDLVPTRQIQAHVLKLLEISHLDGVPTVTEETRR